MCKPFNTNPLANLNWLKHSEMKFIKKILPPKFELKKDSFPNQLSLEYFEFVCQELEVETEYV
jgi:hypothetical protein